ncbi:hypothetical protein P9D43_28925 [Neobacillus niacini]|uniref:hypothetical protein n=1 Tax=Neobacillus niacini TaxID=86668 RepID=UPI00052F4B5F|nr:hypothetical protein [Neobacillus niacini]KGM46073.1 hypothetical protein NP83_02415 [Neobacillus niacini]MEC1526023.1 hypothetical protein [Neobacillus niacini]
MLYIKDPLSFKASIDISLEVLSEFADGLLKEFVDSIPSSVDRVSLETTSEVEESLKFCLVKFKETKTYHWLREDLKNALYDIEIQLNKKVS